MLALCCRLHPPAKFQLLLSINIKKLKQIFDKITTPRIVNTLKTNTAFKRLAETESDVALLMR